MLYYPKIPGPAAAPIGRCLAFEKLDGTNTHWLWRRAGGWAGFGTRRDRFPLTPAGTGEFAAAHPELAGVPGAFTELAAPVSRLFERNDYLAFDEITLFAEYVGPNSFAGRHRAGESRRLRPIDLILAGHGWLAPERFAADFGPLGAPAVLYRGKFTGRFTLDVRRGRYGTGEGVVCKGGSGGADVWMVKVKTDAYLARLKAAFAERWEEHWE